MNCEAVDEPIELTPASLGRVSVVRRMLDIDGAEEEVRDGDSIQDVACEVDKMGAEYVAA